MDSQNKRVKGIRSVSEATAVFSDAFQFPGKRIDPDAPKTMEKDR